GVKVLVGQRDDALRLGCRLGPDDRRAMAHRGIGRQRQDRERPRRQEMLLCPAAVIALVGDRTDNGGLAIAPAVACDPRAHADRRLRAIGGDEKPRRYPAAIREGSINTTGWTAPRILALTFGT